MVQNRQKSVFSVFSKKNIKMFQIFLRIWIHLVFFKKNEKKWNFTFLCNKWSRSVTNFFIFFKFFAKKHSDLTFLCPKHMYATHDQKKARPPRGWMQLMVTFNIKKTITCRVRLVEAPPFWGFRLNIKNVKKFCFFEKFSKKKQFYSHSWKKLEHFDTLLGKNWKNFFWPFWTIFYIKMSKNRVFFLKIFQKKKRFYAHLWKNLEHFDTLLGENWKKHFFDHFGPFFT